MKILVCDGLEAAAVAALQADGHDVDLRKSTPAEDLPAAIAAAECVVVRSATKITRDILAQAPALKLAVRAGVGLDNIDQAAAKERGVAVSNTPAATTTSVAELALGMMIALARHIPQGHGALQNGKWERKVLEGTELSGKTLGLLGFGRIGQGLAKLAVAFGMTVIAYDMYFNADAAKQLGVQAASCDEVLTRSDYLSLHMPVTADTKNFINAERIGKLKAGVRIINTARGDLIDDAALAAAIKDGRVAGAAVDVYAKEPPPADHPLIGLPQVITLPHLGASTKEGQTRAGLEVVDVVRNFLK